MGKKQNHPDGRITVNAAELINIIDNAIERKQHNLNSVRINAEEIMTLVKALTPIKCHSLDCQYHAVYGLSCFLNCIELDKGICRYYRAVPQDKRDMDRKDLPGGFVRFVNGLRPEGSDKD